MSNPRFLGRDRSLALFEFRGKYYYLNVRNMVASAAEESAVTAAAEHHAEEQECSPEWTAVVAAYIARESVPADISHVESGKRTYTVPKRVALTAQNALMAARIPSPTAGFVASLLCSGQQVSCEDVLWLSRFFDCHSEETCDKNTWLAWGGEEGKRWSKSLASRLDYDSVVADSGYYETPGLLDFISGDETERTFWAALVEPRGQHAIGLYKLSPHGTWQAWGNADWFDCDEPQEANLPDCFVELDDEAALYVASALFDSPDVQVDLRTPNPEAWDLAKAAYDEIDWEFVDRLMKPAALMAAAGSPVTDQYTPEERSKNASGQLRDANGRFADVGASGAVKSSGLGGTIESADPTTGLIIVKTSDGASHEIPAKDFEVGAAPHPKVNPSVVKENTDLDLSGIVAPEDPAPMAKATLSEEMKSLAPIQIDQILEEYSAAVTAARQEKAKEFKDLLEEPTDIVEEEHTEVAPIQAAAEGSVADDIPEPSADPTPDSSDVHPIYMAIVDKDDPRSVMDLIALVPTSAVSSEPKTFRRSGGKWVEDVAILQDLRSPTPPPVIQLDEEQYQDVVAQIDFTAEGAPAEAEAEAEEPEQTITSAGGLDRNRGNAEELREYWTVGPGGLKIRWGTGGDWTRCVRLLSKHLGNRAKGYCALRHHEMTGMWPGDKDNRKG